MIALIGGRSSGPGIVNGPLIPSVAVIVEFGSVEGLTGVWARPAFCRTLTASLVDEDCSNLQSQLKEVANL